MPKIFALLFAGVLIYGCAPKIVEVIEVTEETEETVEEIFEETTEVLNTNMMSEDAISGEKVFNEKCTKCHKAKVVDDYSKERWDVVLPKMISKAQLDETEAAQVTAFVEWELNN